MGGEKNFRRGVKFSILNKLMNGLGEVFHFKQTNDRGEAIFLLKQNSRPGGGGNFDI